MWKKIVQGEFNVSDIYNRQLGIGRSLIALGTLITLVFNTSGVLFKPGVGFDIVPLCDRAKGLSIYCMLSDNLELARYISIGILLVVIIGILPRITCILHWWVSFSLNCCTLTLDGGDQVASVLTLILIPICIFDKRKSHWIKASNANSSQHNKNESIFSIVSYVVLQIQVSIIYFHACVSKFNIPEWSNGTALYYFVNSPLLGVNTVISDFTYFFLTSNLSIAILTWSALLLEFFLFSALFFNQRMKDIVFTFGMIFHVLIGILFGILTFSLIMIGTLVLYLKTYQKSPN